MKAAIIGLGRMGAEPSERLDNVVPSGWLPISHAEAILNTPGLDLVSLCDINSAKITKYKKMYGVSRGYTNYKKLIIEDKPDFLGIATRTIIRKDIIEFAVCNGVKMIYAEKPLCNSLTQCYRIISLLKENKINFGLGVNRRYHEVYNQARKIVNEGEIGELLEIIIENGYSNLFWTHPHSVDMILFFAQSTKIESISGICSSLPLTLNNYGVIDLDPLVEHAHFNFTNGIRATILKSRGCNVRLSGTKGNLTIHGDGKFIEIYKGKDYYYNRKIIRFDCAVSATVNAFSNLVNSYLKIAEPSITLEEIEVGMIMLVGIVQSSLNNGAKLFPNQIDQNIFITGRTGEFYA